mmetsp:Transcript_10639/g.32584  ORF Transcript_10639/g.32584 Transcript_10639/m.32584 type:complete len:138 (+) Transcript_10639:161-574(+)
MGWTPNDEKSAEPSPITDEERGRQGAVMYDTFGRARLVGRDEFLRSMPNNMREGIAEGMDDEIAQTRGMSEKELEESIKAFTRSSDVKDYTDCMLNTSYIFTGIGIVAGGIGGVRLKSIGPLMIGLCLGTACDYYRG